MNTAADGALLAAYTTVADEADALRLAELAVRRGLAACVQFEPVRSVYVWQGAIQREGEFRVLFKTTRAALDALREAVLAAHPYELPAFHALAVDHADPRYADWVAQQTRQDAA